MIGDMNAKVGSDNVGFETIMGKEALGTQNDNGYRLVQLCATNNLVIGGSVFKHKDIHKVTWHTPNMEHWNQIDHICINRKWRSSFEDL